MNEKELNNLIKKLIAKKASIPEKTKLLKMMAASFNDFNRQLRDFNSSLKELVK